MKTYTHPKPVGLAGLSGCKTCEGLLHCDFAPCGFTEYLEVVKPRGLRS